MAPKTRCVYPALPIVGFGEASCHEGQAHMTRTKNDHWVVSIQSEDVKNQIFPKTTPMCEEADSLPAELRIATPRFLNHGHCDILTYIDLSHRFCDNFLHNNG